MCVREWVCPGSLGRCTWHNAQQNDQGPAQFLMEVLKVLVLSDSITSLWPASFGLFAWPGLWSLPLVSFSLSFFGAFF